MQLYQSDRTFIVFSYAASHGLLLLRSRKAQGYPTRVDILFQDVRAMELRCWFEGIRIEEADLNFLSGFRSKPERMVEPGNKIYALHGSDWHGYLVAGIFFTKEDQGEYADPSGLIETESNR